MKRKDINVSQDVQHVIWDALVEIAFRHGLMPTEVARPNNKKKKPVEARGDLIEWMCQKLVIPRRKDVPCEVRLRFNGKPVDEEEWRPPSLPVIGALLDQGHDTIKYNRTRWLTTKRETEKPAEQPNG